MAPDEPPAGRRRALLVATATYSDPALAGLRAPTGDVAALAAVLGDAAIGGFEVEQLVDQPTEQLRRQIETYFGGGRPHDLLLFYVSGHGVLSQSRRFYFATADTSLQLLRSTAIEDSFVNDVIQSSRARSIVLILDCCHSGAFGKGLAPKSATTVDVEHRFEGRGRVTLSASTELEYAFEETAVNELEPAAPGSLFTGSVVEGLRSGDADIDQDGRISVDDLYDYVCRRVRERSVHQTPGMAGDVRGQILIAKSPRRAALPAELAHAVESNLAGVRAGAVEELKALLRTGGPPAAGARAALEQLAEDDSRRVAATALAALGRAPPEPASPDAAPERAETVTERAATTGKRRGWLRRPDRNMLWAGAAVLAIVVVVGVLALVLPGDGTEPSGPSEGTPYDFQGSGTQQVVVAAVNADPAAVVIGPDATAESPPITISPGQADVAEAGPGQSFGTGVASGDFNGDGHADLAIGTPDFHAVGVVYGNGSGEFKSAAKHLNGKRFDRYGFALLARDLNADSYSDLAVGAPGAGNDRRYHDGAIQIFFGSGKGLTDDNFRILTPPDGAKTSFGMALTSGQIDDDETVDLVEGARDPAGHLTYCPGTARGPVECRALPAYGEDNGTRALAAADLDNDGNDDIIQSDDNIGPGDDDPGGVRVWRGESEGPAATPKFVLTAERLGLEFALRRVDAGFGWSVDAGLVDDDEYPDIVVGAPGYQKGDGAVAFIRGGAQLVAQQQTLEPITGRRSRFGADVGLLFLDSTDRPNLVVVADNAGADAVLVRRDGAFTPLPGLDSIDEGDQSTELRIGHNAGAG